MDEIVSTPDTLQTTRSLILSVCDIKHQGDIPPACAGSQIVTMGMRVYLFGGADERQSYNTLYLLEIEKLHWKIIDTSGFSKPSCRYGHTLSLFRDSLILFGGLERTDEEEKCLNSGNIQTIIQPPPFADVPTLHLLNNDKQKRLWSHRGHLTSSFYLFSSVHNSWSMILLKPSHYAPSPRAFHTATPISYSRGLTDVHLLVVWGGIQDDTFSNSFNDLYLWNIEEDHWCLPPIQTGSIPTPRYGHQMIYVPNRQSIFLFGGNDDQELYCLDCTPLFTQSHLSSLQSNQCMFIDTNDLNQHTQDIPKNKESQHTVVWSQIHVNGTPPLSRRFHSFHLIQHRLIVVAGLTAAAGFSDVYSFDVLQHKWTRPLYEGDLNISSHCAAVLHDKLLIFGGVRFASYLHSFIPKESALALIEDSKHMDAIHTMPRMSRRLFFLNILEIKQSMTKGHYQFKLVTVGDSGVGKSCLLERFVQDVFEDHRMSTIGIDFRSIITIIRGKIVTIQLWDTAGQERFSGVTGNYYRHADGFILVYDATQYTSFDHIINWVNQIQNHHDFGPSTLKLLIGNKQDLISQIVVPDIEAKQLADKLGAIYLGTSAKTGAGVDTAFLLATSQLIEQRQAVPLSNSRSLGHSSVTLRHENEGTFPHLSTMTDSMCGSCMRGHSTWYDWSS